ncbi:hypothetical protein HBI42_035250 [Parastagonospora nodorum]|nr:hypothetical protein HBI12_038870 [Parastagonospora nodorum]KAH6230230.1 hypothetical protein HBI43_045260 [Parastagonospora nodorum]KAH6269761.1 hypothetical protein HBI42_035250 [Parastagonospora nodorum]
MKTCPTLCATATVVGASAVGLSFGRETPFDSSHSNKKKTTLARELVPGSMSTAVHTSATTTTAPPFGAPISIAPASRISLSARPSQDGRPQRRMMRRMTSGDTGLQASSGALKGYATSEQDTVELDMTGHVPSRRRSWIQRLSIISNSPQSSRNPSPSPAPLSPSVSCSNGSMAFSHDGSTAPMIGRRRSPSPLPPNKLVKRSSSLRRPHETPLPGSGSLRPSFRRPATSHQRSATLQYHSPLLEMTAEDASVHESVRASTVSEPEYTHFFTARVAKDRPLSKALGFRTIVPDGKHTPTLVLARSISAGAEELDSEAGESVFFVSRPGTPLDMTTIVTTSTNALDAVPQHASTTDVSQDAARPRRSFSITDLLSSTKKQATAKARGGRISRRASQRVSSAPPTPTMSRRRSSFSYFADARRRVTDPTLTKRNIATSAGPLQSAESHTALENEPSGASSSQPLPEESVRSAAPVSGPGGALASMPQLEVTASAAALANHMPPSPTLAQPGVRPSRHSMAPSEQASTLVGSSDNEVRGLGSGDEDDADFQSETLFDSLRTGATRSTSGGPRGPRIETIFDESPPSKVKVTALRDLLPPGAFGEPIVNAAFGQHSIAEEEESISTPVRTVRPERSLQDSPSFTRTHSAPLFPNLIPSSPPSMPKPLSLGTLEWDSRAGDDDSSRWSHEEEDAEDSWVDLPTVSHAATPVSLQRSNPRLLATGSSPKPSTPLHLTADHCDREARSSIFDWSEQQPADKSSGNRTPPRPRTVHGKKDADRRGSRSVGRRVPSGLHARSQSVPVVPDATGKRNTVVTNKFGTWGVGSKGVTEDWNDDFDFSELNEDPAAEDADEAPRVDSGTAMVVPKSIQEQQNNVLANIGLLREWGLLIEELKEHKVRAVALGIIDGPQSGMWEEVDAMIDLADQEADHEGVSRLSPPSSPGFDEDAFDELSGPGASPSLGRRKRKSPSPSDDTVRTPTQSSQPRRKTILPPNYGIFGPQSSPIPPKSTYETPRKISGSKTIITRPRKDSEAKARSVIEALQKRKTVFEQGDGAPPTPSSKKVPFDTATLRRIVPYVNTLTRKVKDAIRDAEGLYSSPNASPRHEEPPFSNLFQQDTDLAAQMHRMTVM